MKYQQTGNGAWCPQDPEHGRMFALSSGNEFCAHAAHTGNYMYRPDGLTPVSRSALEPASGGIGGARPGLSTPSEQPASAEGLSA
jgi:hypothetical protein